MKALTLTLGLALSALTSLSVSAQGLPLIGVGSITSTIRGADPASFQTMVETELTKTNKFHLIERSRLQEILGEKALGANGITTGDTSISGIKGVDYLIYGTITKLGASTQSTNVGGGFSRFTHGFGSGFASASSKVEMAVDLRVVDAHDGSIKYADTVDEQVDSAHAVRIGGTSFGGQSSDPLADVQRLTAKAIVALISTSIYPIKIITQEGDGTYVLNYGDSVLTVGDMLNVYKVGQSFRDPDTGKILGAEETQIGLLKVTETDPGFSKATLVKGIAAAGSTVKRISSTAKSGQAQRGPQLP